MSDEQVIYIDPEDDLTNVRERLERLPNRKVTLVIPAQTQLRSHVAWKLLHSRARELGKDIFIISSDPQIRSVAQAVKFRVANSLESAQEGRSRPAGGATRSGGRPSSSLGGKGKTSTSALQRTSTGKSLSEERANNTARARRTEVPNDWPRAAAPQSPTQGGRKNLEEEQSSKLRQSNSRPLDLPGNQFASPYGFIETSPPIRPLEQEQLLEEPDLLLEDFQQARDIREAASRSGQEDLASTPEARENVTHPGDAEAPDSRSSATGAPYRITPLPNIADDPFASLDDLPYTPTRAEQQGDINFHGFDTHEHTVQDLSHLTPDIMGGDIEDQGDLGDFVIHSDTPPASLAHSWTAPTPDDEEDVAGPSKVYGMRPRGSRGGKVPPLIPGSDFEAEDALPPVEDRPTQIIPPPTSPRPLPLQGSRTSTAALAGTGNKPMSQPLAPQSRRPNSQELRRAPSQELRRPNSQDLRRPNSQELRRAPSQELRRSPSQEVKQRPAAPARPEVRPAPRQQVQAQQVRPATPRSTATGKSTAAQAKPRPTNRKRISLGNMLPLIAVLAIFLLLALLAWLPTAEVTVKLPGKAYSQAIKLTTTTDKTQATRAGFVLAQLYQHEVDDKGNGTASGQATVGTNSATGHANFINNSDKALIIPSGVIVSTPGPNSVSFSTTAEARVDVKGSAYNLVTVPIKAQKAGNAGNVDAGTITVIPDDSLSAIAQANNITVQNIKLTVNNDAATTGGGVGNAPAIQQKDIDGAKATLSKHLQTEFDQSLKQQANKDDILGPSSKTGEVEVSVPKANQVINNGNTFSLELKDTYTALLIHQADIQNATINQLRSLMSKDKNYAGYQLVSDPQHPVKFVNQKVTGDTKSLTVTFTAVAQVVPEVSATQVQSWVAGVGRPVAQTEAAVRDQILAKHKVHAQVEIHVSPGFYPVVPFLQDHVHVHIIAA